MQDENLNAQDELPPYTPEQEVFRAIIYEDWIRNDGKSPTPQAFKRRRKDISGVSIGVTPDGCKEGLFEPTFGEIVLIVGKIREIQKSNGEYLDAVPDGPTHGNIKELPFKDDIQEQIEATRLAKALANIATKYMPEN